MNFQLNGRAVWLYRPVKASKVAESSSRLAKSLGVTTFFWMTEKKISINRPWEKYPAMSDSGYLVSRLRWPWMLAMTRECRATSVCQPRAAASSRSAVTSASWAWSCGMNSGAVT